MIDNDKIQAITENIESILRFHPEQDKLSPLSIWSFKEVVVADGPGRLILPEGEEIDQERWKFDKIDARGWYDELITASLESTILDVAANTLPKDHPADPDRYEAFTAEHDLEEMVADGADGVDRALSLIALACQGTLEPSPTESYAVFDYSDAIKLAVQQRRMQLDRLRRCSSEYCRDLQKITGRYRRMATEVLANFKLTS
jgi:hypothetical protein